MAHGTTKVLKSQAQAQLETGRCVRIQLRFNTIVTLII